MALYINGFTSSQIASGIALSIIFDVNENNLGLDGIPQIKIKRSAESRITVVLTFDKRSAEFEITNGEAKLISEKAKLFQHDLAIFDRVQSCLATLERQR